MTISYNRIFMFLFYRVPSEPFRMFTLELFTGSMQLYLSIHRVKM
jgi:hypothetical protein